jgi:GNAT superfamily N-acetyltransferase
MLARKSSSPIIGNGQKKNGNYMMDITIRDAIPDDSAQVLTLIKGLARYERAEDEVVATVDDIEGALFGENARTRALIAELDRNSVGFALFFYNFSTWTGKYGIYLEDLFVEPEFRGYGIGQALMKHLARIAVDEDCARFEWSVLDWNEPSIRFYEALGAEAQSEWIGYRLSGDALKKLTTD